MKATGIVRRIDDLGRVVIPKEIRRNLRIREGEPLEIFVDKDGGVILKKYSPIGELSTLAAEYASAIHDSLSLPVFVSDRDSIVAAEGVSKKDYIGRRIGFFVERAMSERRSLLNNNNNEPWLAEDNEGDLTLSGCLAVPIIVQGDPVGAVIIASNDTLGDMEIKVAQSAAAVLAKQMDS